MNVCIDAKWVNMIWQQWHHYFHSVGGNCKLSFQAVDTPGGDGLLTTFRSEKNIWLLFDVDKLPGAPKTKLVSLTLFVFFPQATNSHRIASERSRRNGLQVIAPSCEGMDVGGIIGSTERERERETERERERERKREREKERESRERRRRMRVHPLLPVSLSSQLSHSLQNH